MKRSRNKPLPIFERPTRDEVEEAILFPDRWLPNARIPTKEACEWKKDHAAFYIARVFPILDMPRDIRQIVVEAYLTKGLEAWSDGSTLVPDRRRYGNTKDWQGVMHDYIFYLHHRGLPDTYGHVWGYWQANNAYRRGWLCEGDYARSAVWWFGLTVGSWPVWEGWL